MNEILVVGAAPIAGAEAFYGALLSEAAHVVAADAAGEWCVRLGRVPDFVVGDFDSSSEGAVDRLTGLGACIERFPTDKALTDLEIAVDVALRHWTAPICITAAFTGRLDHTLAAIGLLTRAGAQARIAEPDWRAWTADPAHPLRLRLAAGSTFSIIALEACSGVTARGGRWELVGQVLQPLSGRGVSNEALDADITVSVEQGRLLVLSVDDVD